MDDERGKYFLGLIDEQSKIQWNIVAKLTALMGRDWNSDVLRSEIKDLVERHAEITRELNSAS